MRTAVAWIRKAVAHMGGVWGKICNLLAHARRRLNYGECEGGSPWYETLYNLFAYGKCERLRPSQKTPCRNAQQASQFYKSCELRLTSSTWGGRLLAAFLLTGVFVWLSPYLYSIPKDAVTLQHIELYAVIAIGIVSLYFAGTDFWGKQGSAFFVEYQTATDSDLSELMILATTQEEIIGNPANSTMPYVKKLCIYNTKNRHEVIKRILLQLPNKKTLILKEYKEGNTLFVKPYEYKVIQLNAVTVYFKERDWSRSGREGVAPCNGFMYVLKNERLLRDGEIIIETAQGQSYIKSSKKPVLFYDKEDLLKPSRHFFSETYDEWKLVFDIKILCSVFIFMKESFVDDSIFYSDLREQFSQHSEIAGIFYKKEGRLVIQVTIDDVHYNTSLSYFFEFNKKKYAFSVHPRIKEKFDAEYQKFYAKYSKCKFPSTSKVYENVRRHDFCKDFSSFCSQWASNEWNKDENELCDFGISERNKLSIDKKVIKIIDDEEP